MNRAQSLPYGKKLETKFMMEAKQGQPNSIDEYIAQFPEEVQQKLPARSGR